MARRVLHYNSRQMYFECNHGIVAEDGSRIEARYLGDMGLHKGTYLPSKSLTHEVNPQVASLDDWNYLVCAYGSRKLSRLTDKFPACESILVFVFLFL